MIFSEGQPQRYEPHPSSERDLAIGFVSVDFHVFVWQSEYRRGNYSTIFTSPSANNCWIIPAWYFFNDFLRCRFLCTTEISPVHPRYRVLLVDGRKPNISICCFIFPFSCDLVFVLFFLKAMSQWQRIFHYWDHVFELFKSWWI